MPKSKLWGGTFAKKTAAIVERFTDSTRYESRLVPYDLQGSMAHARMLGKQGIISKPEAARLESGLRKILALWKAGKFKLDPAYEDVDRKSVV
jgi:argininosuccinate lyase